MKHIFLYFLLAFGSLSVVKAQEQPQEEGTKKAQKIQALYIAYISQQLKLTPAEAEKFWPLHTQFDNEVKAVDPEMDELPRQQKILDIKKKYEDKFTKILGNNRTNDFFRQDGEFRKKLVDVLRKKRQQNNMNRPLNRRNR